MARHRADVPTPHPWRTVVRTVFELVVALAAGAPIIYAAVAGGDPELATGGIAVVLAVAGAITKVMALPWTEAFLQRFAPWLAAHPRPARDETAE